VETVDGFISRLFLNDVMRDALGSDVRTLAQLDGGRDVAAFVARLQLRLVRRVLLPPGPGKLFQTEAAKRAFNADNS